MPPEPWGGLPGLSPVIGRPSLAQAMFPSVQPPPDPFAAMPFNADNPLLQQLLEANRARLQQYQSQGGMSPSALEGFGQLGQLFRGAGTTAPTMSGPGGLGGAVPF
jgi:hypothetical protein